MARGEHDRNRDLQLICLHTLNSNRATRHENNFVICRSVVLPAALIIWISMGWDKNTNLRLINNCSNRICMIPVTSLMPSPKPTWNGGEGGRARKEARGRWMRGQPAERCVHTKKFKVDFGGQTLDYRRREEAMVVAVEVQSWAWGQLRNTFLSLNTHTSI